MILRPVIRLVLALASPEAGAWAMCKKYLETFTAFDTWLAGA